MISLAILQLIHQHDLKNIQGVSADNELTEKFTSSHVGAGASCRTLVVTITTRALADILSSSSLTRTK